MIQDARKTTFDASCPIFFDANVWLTIYSPPSKEDDYWKGEYTKVLNRIVNNKIPVLLDATVVSEYINRFCRIEFDAYEEYMHPNSERTFKEFRTQDFATYLPIANSAAASVKDMLEIPSLRRINGDFAAMDVITMLDKFALGKSDWNDQQIIDLCKRNECSLLTNDADFGDADISILTCNGRLLGRITQS